MIISFLIENCTYFSILFRRFLQKNTVFFHRINFYAWSNETSCALLFIYSARNSSSLKVLFLCVREI